jgi:hypothetical protein
LCKTLKPLEDFAINRSKSDGRSSMCKICKKAYNHEYYDRTKDRHNPGRAARREEVKNEVRQKVYEYLRVHPCVDCGESDVVVLDFDHQRDKKLDVSQMIHNSVCWERVRAEIEKCEVVCANDHRRRTAAKFGWWRAMMVAA